MARAFENGWAGLKSYALAAGIIGADDGDDVAASKIKSVLQGTLPEEKSEPESKARTSSLRK